MVIGVGARALDTDADIVVSDLTGVAWIDNQLVIEHSCQLRGPRATAFS